MEITNKPLSVKSKLIYSMQAVTFLTIILYFAWFIVDCMFISKGIYYEGAQPTWDENLYQTMKNMAIVFISFASLVVACNIAYLIHRAFTLKANLGKHIYGIIINSLIIIFGLITIISIADYIKQDSIVIAWTGLLETYLSHTDFVSYVSALLIVCAFSAVMTWKKKDTFNIDYLESDFKLNIKTFGISSAVFYPFMVWLLMPVNLMESTNNLIGHVVASPMSMCFAVVFIALFAEFILQIYKRTKLFNKDNLSLIITYGILFLVICALFITSQSQMLILTFWEENVSTSWKTAIGLTTPELALSLCGVFLSFFDHRIMKRKEIENVYA